MKDEGGKKKKKTKGKEKQQKQLTWKAEQNQADYRDDGTSFLLSFFLLLLFFLYLNCFVGDNGFFTKSHRKQ